MHTVVILKYAYYTCWCLLILCIRAYQFFILNWSLDTTWSVVSEHIVWIVVVLCIVSTMDTPSRVYVLCILLLLLLYCIYYELVASILARSICISS